MNYTAIKSWKLRRKPAFQGFRRPYLKFRVFGKSPSVYFISIIVKRQSPNHQDESGPSSGHAVTGVPEDSVYIYLNSRKVATMVPPNTTGIVRTVRHQPRTGPSTLVGTRDNAITERCPSFRCDVYAVNSSNSRALRWFQRFHCRIRTGWYWRAQFPRVTTECLYRSSIEIQKPALRLFSGPIFGDH